MPLAQAPQVFFCRPNKNWTKNLTATASLSLRLEKCAFLRALAGCPACEHFPEPCREKLARLAAGWHDVR
jgi:hypothetical protein